MAKFKFPLQNLLQIKEKLEDQCQMEYGKAVQQRDVQLYKINQIKDDILAVNQVFYQKQANTFQVRDLIIIQNKISFLKQEEKEAVRLLQDLEELVIQKREMLAKAMQERKTYELLKEKALEVFYEEEKQEEIKQIDERASFNYSQNREG